MIIIEGPDCAGKTTFINLLTQQLASQGVSHHRVHSGPPEPRDRDPFEEYEHRLDRMSNGSVVVADRWHWGEPVYGPIFRNKDRLGTAGWRHVELSLLARGALVVYLHETSTVLLERLMLRGDPLTKPEHLCDIEAGYHWCLRNTALPVLSLRSPGPREAAYVADIHRRVSTLALGPVTTAQHPSYIGGQRPRVLLFGEKRGGEPPHNGDRLAFTPRGSTSGRWLLESLSERLWPNVGIANALEGDPMLLRAHLGFPTTIALGHSAHERLKAQGIPHSAVPHPQWVRRFVHDQLPEYGELIEDVSNSRPHRNELNWKGT